MTLPGSAYRMGAALREMWVEAAKRYGKEEGGGNDDSLVLADEGF